MLRLFIEKDLELKGRKRKKNKQKNSKHKNYKLKMLIKDRIRCSYLE